MLKKICSFIFLSFLLTGCNQTVSYTYLMLHPEAIEGVLEQCAAKERKGLATGDRCEEAKRAARDFKALAEERIANSDAFGEKIMSAESDLAKSSPADYQKQKEKVDILLSVVAATSSRD